MELAFISMEEENAKHWLNSYVKKLKNWIGKGFENKV